MGLKKKIRDFFENLFGKFFKCENCKEYEEKLENLRKVINGANQIIKSLQKEVDELRDKLKKEAKNDKQAEYWNNKHRKVTVTYPGRSLPFSKKKCSVPVNVLVTPNDPQIHKDLEKWGFKKKVENQETDNFWETLIPKLYHKIQKEYYNYEYDKNVWGNKEVWEFPFEMRQKGLDGGFDCDSWAIFQVSYYIALGLPRWRVRVVGGKCSLGGHASVYVFSTEDKKWHHLNSTYGTRSKHKKLSKFPTHKDAEEGNDKMGIKEVWFSFNDKYIWSDFGVDMEISTHKNSKKHLNEKQ